MAAAIKRDAVALAFAVLSTLALVVLSALACADLAAFASFLVLTAVAYAVSAILL